MNFQSLYERNIINHLSGGRSFAVAPVLEIWKWRRRLNVSLRKNLRWRWDLLKFEYY